MTSSSPAKKRNVKVGRKISAAAAAVAVTAPAEEIQEYELQLDTFFLLKFLAVVSSCSVLFAQCYKFYHDAFFRYKLPSWAMFELGMAPVYWKTMNGLPPTSVSMMIQCRL